MEIRKEASWLRKLDLLRKQKQGGQFAVCLVLLLQSIHVSQCVPHPPGLCLSFFFSLSLSHIHMYTPCIHKKGVGKKKAQGDRSRSR